MRRAICVSVEGLSSFWPRRSVDSLIGPLFFFFFFFSPFSSFSEKSVIVSLISYYIVAHFWITETISFSEPKQGFLPHVLESQ